MRGRCSPVRMSTTPGRLRAAETSIDLDKNTQNRATQRSPTACRPWENVPSENKIQEREDMPPNLNIVLCHTIEKEFLGQ